MFVLHSSSAHFRFIPVSTGTRWIVFLCCVRGWINQCPAGNHMLRHTCGSPVSRSRHPCRCTWTGCFCSDGPPGGRPLQPDWALPPPHQTPGCRAARTRELHTMHTNTTELDCRHQRMTHRPLHTHTDTGRPWLGSSLGRRCRSGRWWSSTRSPAENYRQSAVTNHSAASGQTGSSFITLSTKLSMEMTVAGLPG